MSRTIGSARAAISGGTDVLHELRRLPRPLWVLYVATAVLRVGAFVYPYLAIFLTRERGFSPLDAGWILAAGGCGLIAGNLVGGQLTDRCGRKATLLLALAINVAGYLALLAPHDTGVGCALSLGVAYLGMGMFTPAAQTAVADLVRPEQRTLAYTGFYLSSNLGIAIGPLLGGVLAAHSFTLVFVGDVVSTLVGAVLLLIGLPRLPPTRDPNSGRATGGLLRVYARHPRVALFCGAAFFLIAPLMGLEYAVPLLVEREFGAQLHWVGVVYSVNAATILTCSIGIERWARDKGELPCMLLAAGFWVTGLLTLAIGWSVASVIASTLIWTLGEILTSILVPSYVAARVAPAVKGRFLALADLGRSAAYLLSPVGLGYLWHAHGASTAVAAIVALPVVGFVCFAILYLVRARRLALPPRGAA